MQFELYRLVHKFVANFTVWRLYQVQNALLNHVTRFPICDDRENVYIDFLCLTNALFLSNNAAPKSGMLSLVWNANSKQNAEVVNKYVRKPIWKFIVPENLQFWVLRFCLKNQVWRERETFRTVGGTVFLVLDEARTNVWCFCYA